MAGNWTDAAEELSTMLENGASIDDVEEAAAHKLNELLDES